MTTEEIALDIADESEASFLLSYCETICIKGKNWLEVTPLSDSTDEAMYGPHARRALDWLTRRNLIERHPTREHLVRVTSHTMGQKSLAPFES